MLRLSFVIFNKIISNTTKSLAKNKNCTSEFG